MIGGPTDIVVEPNIVRAMPGRDQMAPRPAVGGAETQPRIAPLPDAGNWSDGDGRSDPFDHAEPQMPEPPLRPARPSFAEEVRRPVPPPAPERRPERADRADPLAGFAPEPLGGRPEPRPELRPEPMPSRVTSRSEPVLPRTPRPSDMPKPPPMRAPERAAAPPLPSPPPPSPSTADQNLAEMAQRLEAALRRPAGDAGEPRVGAPPVAPEPPPARAPRSEEPPAAPPAKSGFENLEDEMASLLGRPKSPS
jgi:flagellar protein FliO/FliZ